METYLTIGRLLVDNKDYIRTPGITGRHLIKELNDRIGEVEQIIITFDNDAERLAGRRNSQTLGHIWQIQEDRDKLCIELELYKGIRNPGK